MNPTAS
jgi:SHAQKYF class myb-like DNA-binding protein